MKSIFKSNIVTLIILTISFLIIHYGILLLLGQLESTQSFVYPIHEMYGIFFLFALAMYLLVVNTHKIKPDIVGFAFLAGTVIQMLFAYIVARPIFANATEDTLFERINFLAVFFIFLLIEVVITAKILNIKLEKPLK